MTKTEDELTKLCSKRKIVYTIKRKWGKEKGISSSQDQREGESKKSKSSHAGYC